MDVHPPQNGAIGYAPWPYEHVSGAEERAEAYPAGRGILSRWTKLSSTLIEPQKGKQSGGLNSLVALDMAAKPGAWSPARISEAKPGRLFPQSIHRVLGEGFARQGWHADADGVHDRRPKRGEKKGERERMRRATELAATAAVVILSRSKPTF